jgi:hypothetical protein
MKHSIRGDISLFIVVVVSSLMLGSAILLGLISARQSSLTQDLVASERAFYAASTGLERGFYLLALTIQDQGGPSAPADIPLADFQGTVDYTLNGITASACYSGNISRVGGAACGEITGHFSGEQRRVQIGPAGCAPPPPDTCP